MNLLGKWENAVNVKIAEQTVQDRMAESESISMEEALDQCCSVKCERHVGRGYSP